jgi:hypothetical protein
VIRYSGTADQLKKSLRQMVAVLAGDAPDAIGIANGFYISIGLAALSDIHEAYVIKSRGGRCAMGYKWEKLAESTIKGRKKKQGHKARTSALRKVRKKMVEVHTKILERSKFDGYLLTMSEKQARAKIKKLAEGRVTRNFGFTSKQVESGQAVEILRDRGILLNSLTPGMMSGSVTNMSYSTPPGEGGGEQVFEFPQGSIFIGTKVKYAGVHQHGSKKRKIPARPFLPVKDKDIPASWRANWVNAGKESVSSIIKVIAGS